MSQRSASQGEAEQSRSLRERLSPFADGVSRRRLLQSSGALGASAAVAGCLGDEPDSESTVFVFNTGEMTVSLIDAVNDELLRSEYIGTTSSWPANQYASTVPENETIWINVEGGVQALDPNAELEQLTEIETGSDANWQELTPNGDYLLVSAREPAHTHYRIDADPSSETFGEITAEIDRSDEAEAPEPCDITLGPDGAYAFSPDRGIDVVSVIATDPFEIVEQLELEPRGEEPVMPFMATASWDGNFLAIENLEGEHGTESLVDISDPTAPEEVHRFTHDDGLTSGPITSEWGPDNEILYVFGEEVALIDIPAREVIDTLDVGGVTRTGTWNPAQDKLYVPIQENDEVAVIEHDSGEHIQTIEVGASPRSATARSVRPGENSQARFMASLARLGLTFGDEPTPTYCEESCHCGHHCGELSIDSTDR